ncbi:MAG: hypothetical protein R3F11_09740 [Verrucomicrobiales bacterium]
MSSAATHPPDLAILTGDHFRPCVGGEFTFSSPEGGSVRAKLAAVEDLPDHSGVERRVPFALLFKCDEACLPQGIYEIEHPDLATMACFLSPISGGQGHCELEAIFN